MIKREGGGDDSFLKLTAELVVQLPGDAVEFAEAAHEGVTKTAEVGPVFRLLREDATGISFASNMEDFDEVILNPFTDSVVLKFHMVHILHGGNVGPVHSGFLVIVN